MKQLFIIDYESAHWCGGQSHCVAWATNDGDATEAASEFMEEHMRELFSDELADDRVEGGDADEDVQYAVMNVQPLLGSGYEEYYADEVQRVNFYPCVNESEAPDA